MGASEVLGELFELVQRLAGRVGSVVCGMDQAVVDMVVDQGLLGRRHRAFDRMQLLGEFHAGAAGLDHADDVAQVPLGAFQPFDDLGVGLVNDVGHRIDLSSPGG